MYGIFQINLANFINADVLAPYNATPSAAMALTMQDSRQYVLLGKVSTAWVFFSREDMDCKYIFKHINNVYSIILNTVQHLTDTSTNGPF